MYGIHIYDSFVKSFTAPLEVGEYVVAIEVMAGGELSVSSEVFSVVERKDKRLKGVVYVLVGGLALMIGFLVWLRRLGIFRKVVG